MRMFSFNRVGEKGEKLSIFPRKIVVFKEQISVERSFLYVVR